MFEWLSAQGHKSRILSVTLDAPSRAPPEYEFIRPIRVPVPCGDERYNSEFHWMNATDNYASKTLTFPRIMRAIQRVSREFRPDVVHFTENYGPAMALLPLLGDSIPLTISTPTYSHNAPFYDWFLQRSLQSFDAVAPFSDAYSEVIRKYGLPRSKIVTIRWGVDVDKTRPPTDKERSEARDRLGISQNRVLLAWTGFIQQTNWGDFWFAYHLAELVREAAPQRFAFGFCFKPVFYERAFLAWERPGVRIFGSSEEFSDVLRAADYLLSPIQSPNSTVAPPLTWLEALAMGVPLLVTPGPGVQEVVLPGENGLVVRTPEEARDWLLGPGGDPELIRRLRIEARRVAEERFTLAQSGRRFVDLWKSLVDRRPAVGASVDPKSFG